MSEPDTAPPRPEWNRRGGDRDQPYRFGRPEVYLSVREAVRLTILRYRLQGRPS